MGLSKWLLIAVLSWSSGFVQERTGYQEWLYRLVDPETLARIPGKGEKQTVIAGDDRTMGYYEPGVLYPGDPSFRERHPFPVKEGEKYVLAEMEGPGAITWIWSALPGEGNICIYVDGSDEPLIDASFYEWYGNWGHRFPNLVYRAGRSLNFFVPIPFKKSCKVVAEEDFGEYYQIGYRSYPRTAFLPDLKKGFGTAELEALAQLDRLLGKRGPDPLSSRDGEMTENVEMDLPPGETLTVFEKKGPAVITSFRVSVDVGQTVPFLLLRPEASGRLLPGTRRELPDSPADRNVLRELTLAMYWDGETDPAVWAPLGDFFGTAPGWNTYRSWPAGITNDLMYSHWYMPFSKEARITLSNGGTKARKIRLEITCAPLKKPAANYGRFHTRWVREKNMKEQGKALKFLSAKGKGRFCGFMLDIYNPAGNWWGDCTYGYCTDGEKTARWSGFGLDGYFGTWGNNTYGEAFQAHTINDRSMVHRNHECLNRWHITDNIPFRKSLECLLRKEFPKSDSVSYTAALFYYLDGKNTGPVEMPDLPYRLDPPNDPDFGSTQCTEGEDMEIQRCSGGTVTPLYVEGLHTGGWGGLKGKAHLWWYGCRTGDTLQLAFPVETDGKYKLRIHFIRGEEYGRFKTCLNGMMIDGSLNLKYKHLAPLGPLDYGVHNLERGQQVLMFISEDTVADPTKTVQFGLDYIQLERWDGSRSEKSKSSHVTTGEFVHIFKESSVNDHCYVPGHDGKWHFFGIGGAGGFAHGVSESLMAPGWTSAERPFPVQWNTWKEMHLWAPHVVRHNGLYYMFYCAGGKTGSIYRMMLAISPDLKTWTRHPDNPLFIDGFDARDPMVMKLGDQWVMYYCANTTPQGGNHVVACRVSNDLIHWGERQIVFVDPRRHKAGGPTESPFVVRRGDTYYLFIGPREGYVGTDVFASGDPFNWHLDDKVGHIDSHAAEVVRDTNGKWYVSHSGVGEGGLYLAPLYWNDGLDGADASIPVPVPGK